MEKYNGWTNYETWRVNLELFDGYELEETITSIFDFQEYIKEFAYEAITSYGEIPEDSLAVSYASAFINAVNWYEIAESIVDSNDKFICEDCDGVFDKKDLHHYKYEPEIELCESCHDDRMEE